MSHFPYNSVQYLASCQYEIHTKIYWNWCTEHSMFHSPTQKWERKRADVHLFQCSLLNLLTKVWDVIKNAVYVRSLYATQHVPVTHEFRNKKETVTKMNKTWAAKNTVMPCLVSQVGSTFSLTPLKHIKLRKTQLKIQMCMIFGKFFKHTIFT
jgi:hypothetical protein